MLGTVDLPTFVLGALLIVLLPGPNSLYVLTVGARKGVRTGYRAACGVFLGDAVLLTLTAAGAAYLAWLGFGMVRSAVKAWRQRAASASAAQTAEAAEAAAMAEAVEAAER